jgi:hypothetical protein
MPRTVRRWTTLGDERLLDLRFRDLDAHVEGSAIEPLVKQVWGELEERGLKFKPHVWVSTEWFSPDGVPGIAVPFYLVHPRLLRLERSMMIEAEGSSREECLMILRHEAGHAAQHAWRLQRREGWRRTFGDPSRPYPTIYRPNPPASATCSTCASTTPRRTRTRTSPRRSPCGWRRARCGGVAMPAGRRSRSSSTWTNCCASCAVVTPPVRTRRQVEPLSQVSQTLREHYVAKQAHQASQRPTIPDRDLQRLFAAEPDAAANPPRRSSSGIAPNFAAWWPGSPASRSSRSSRRWRT